MLRICIESQSNHVQNISVRPYPTGDHLLNYHVHAQCEQQLGSLSAFVYSLNLLERLWHLKQILFGGS